MSDISDLALMYLASAVQKTVHEMEGDLATCGRLANRNESKIIESAAQYFTDQVTAHKEAIAFLRRYGSDLRGEHFARIKEARS